MEKGIETISRLLGPHWHVFTTANALLPTWGLPTSILLITPHIRPTETSDVAPWWEWPMYPATPEKNTVSPSVPHKERKPLADCLWIKTHQTAATDIFKLQAMTILYVYTYMMCIYIYMMCILYIYILQQPWCSPKPKEQLAFGLNVSYLKPTLS